jgi:hypothetical protein
LKELHSSQLLLLLLQNKGERNEACNGWLQAFNLNLKN